MKVALYARVSTEEQNPEMQIAQLKKKADLEGWEYDLYEEKESTRKTRPIKYELYNKLLAKEYDAVVVWKLDRWARSTQEASREIETLFNRGVSFISLTDHIDLSTASGRLQFHIITAFAEFERDIIRERVKAGMKNSKKRLGRPKGSKDKKPRRKSGYYMRWNKNE